MRSYCARSSRASLQDARGRDVLLLHLDAARRARRVQLGDLIAERVAEGALDEHPFRLAEPVGSNHLELAACRLRRTCSTR